MKKRTRNKLLAFIAVMLIAVLVVMPVSAGNKIYPSVTVGIESTDPTAVTHPDDTISLTKTLSLPADANVPECGFAFTIVPGDAIEADNVKAGITARVNNVDYPKIPDIIFDANQRKDSPKQIDTAESTCSESVFIDFSNVEFTEPGIYRYVITEAAAINATTSAPYPNIAIGYDTYTQRILDVYVEDDSTAATPKLKYKEYTMIKNDGTANPPSPEDATDYNAEKSDRFVNTYPTNTLTLSKTVEGNQGSKDEYFKFTITLTEDETQGVLIGDTLLFAISGQDRVPTANAATKYTDTELATNDVEVLTGAQLKAGYNIYLQNGDTVTLSGLVENCGFTIVEANNNYTVATTLSQTGKTDVTGDTATVSGTLDVDAAVAYVNTKNGTIPTGVILSVAPWAIAGVVILAGVVFFAIRSRKKYEEE